MFEKPYIRPLESHDLPMVLVWRNDPRIRSCMLTQHEISLDEHRTWFSRVSNDETRRQLIVEDQGGPIGFVQFSGVMEGGISEWSFHTAPNSKKGSGKKLGIAALNYAFEVLKLHKVCGQVLISNRASLAFHARLGFVKEGVLREQCFVNGVYLSMICFGLITKEWGEL